MDNSFSLLPTKPAVGAPCTGCGLCCAQAVCRVGQQYLPGGPHAAPCPALEYADGRLWCGLVRRPHHYLGLSFRAADSVLRPLFAALLGIAQGCDSWEQGSA
jgi:hypothetical protein